MKRYQAYIKRIKRYQKKISKQNSKLNKKVRKFKNYLKKIGISSSEEFELMEPLEEKVIFPCDIGLIFIGDLEKDLFNELELSLETSFDCFFYNVINLGSYNFPNDTFQRGIKKEVEMSDPLSNGVELHPTNKFHQLLIEKKVENKVDLIIAITDMPIYSSTDNKTIFLFGEAHIKHNSCVISILKLREIYYNRPFNINLFKSRLIKTVIHEVGHLILGPQHCLNDYCVMKFSESVAEIDKKSIKFCRECYSKLTQIKNKYNF